jgi:hypothetical protein
MRGDPDGLELGQLMARLEAVVASPPLQSIFDM